ncbi:MAG: glucose-6-phosphate isomerase [Deltaproteobacteria bacterium]|jgi:glucose-6-phosphate isomerase|nr:glucose-6-phosphate isomerase [Deltaproteobacteria bacterium]
MAPSTDLDTLPAFATLQALSHQLPDLTDPALLTPDRLQSHRSHSAGFDLFYATQRVDEPILTALQALADQGDVIEQFLAMKRGAVMNRIEGWPSENRQVLHTACRDVFGAPHAPEATGQAEAELKKLAAFLDDLDQGRLTNEQGQPFTDMIQVGIGGSDLGPRALYLALAAYSRQGRQIHFIANVDPDDGLAVLKGLDLSRTLVNVFSKSGTTQETLTNEELVKAAFIRAGLDPARHFLSVTGQGSPMDDPAKYLRSFYIYDYIGGRYSATSMVGGVMLGFALGAENFREILHGARDMDRAAEERESRRNVPLLLALLGIWNRNFLHRETLAILPYSQGLCRFTAHLQQCDMESNGKSCNRQGKPLSYQTGPVVWGEPGTNGQHAFYQLMHQGTGVIPVEFIGFRNNQYDGDILVKKTTSQEKLTANLLAQSLALAMGRQHDNPNRFFAGNRPNSLLMADRLTPYSMGALLALYEAKIVFQGFLWNINSFDQEGVQLGKILASRLLDHMAGQQEDAQYDGSRTDALGWALMQITGVAKR